MQIWVNKHNLKELERLNKTNARGGEGIRFVMHDRRFISSYNVQGFILKVTY